MTSISKRSLIANALLTVDETERLIALYREVDGSLSWYAAGEQPIYRCQARQTPRALAEIQADWPQGSIELLAVNDGAFFVASFPPRGDFERDRESKPTAELLPLGGGR